MITHETIPDYYDWLSRYVQLANWLSYRDRFASFTMHKALAVPHEASAGGRRRTKGLEYVNARLLKAAQLSEPPRALDAGCGFGGTIFHWHERVGGTYDGLTLSRVQLRVAQRTAQRRGISDVCRFHLKSYDAPVTGSYDVITAIESLIHSPDLNHTIPNLAKSLRTGGLMLMLDDMAKVNLEREAPAEAELLRLHWGCVHYHTQEDYRRAIESARLAIIHEEDLTTQVQPRSPAMLDRLESIYERLYKVFRLSPVRTVLSAYLGGLALERLYLAKRVSYRLIVARKQA